MTNERSRHFTHAVLAALLLLVATVASAAAGRPGQDAVDQVARLVFPPELVIRFQERIGLSTAQRERLVAEMQATQSDLVPLQIEISGAGERLAELLGAARVDELAVLALTEEMLALEAQIKRRHMALLVRIKNLLTEDQQRALYRIRRQWRDRARERR